MRLSTGLRRSSLAAMLSLALACSGQEPQASDAVPDTTADVSDTAGALDADATPPADGPNTTCLPSYPGHTVGLLACSDQASAGYTLLVPILSTETFLIDNLGNEVHRWPGINLAGFHGYLTEDGTLVRAGKVVGAPGWLGVMFASGMVQKIAWDGTVLWSFTMAGTDKMMHHDVAPLPNGNVLVLAWERKTKAEVLAAGRDPAKLTTDGLWMDMLLELEPVGDKDAKVVWEWHAWDHLIQDFDPTKPNYGDPALHPERLDFNSSALTLPEWLHMNAVDYHPGLDQILLTLRSSSEVVVIDHGTTTAEAKGSSGGKRGKGGDLLYRWGNPAMYGQGTVADQQLFGCHDGSWIEPGLPGAGRVLVFNNGSSRPDGHFYSSVEEFEPALDATGGYLGAPGKAFGPAKALWTYKADPPASMYSAHMSSAQRLPNGHTLVCDGSTGTITEVTPAGETVWAYRNPMTLGGPVTQGQQPPPGPTGVGSGIIVFKARRYAPDFPGFEGKTLTPKKPIELPAKR